MVQTHNRPFTLEDFLQLPDTKPAQEYINGQIIQKPMPQGDHSIIQGELTTALNAVLKQQRVARAFPELCCTFAGRAMVPDVSVYTWERIPRRENGEVALNFAIAPDWIIEILSPEQSYTKLTQKILSCFKEETQLGWLIHPQEKSVFVYFPDAPVGVFDTAEMVLPVPGFAQDFRLTVGNLFHWLMN
ncbi:MAG: Uma2 family endonuclease [Kamptonema sp. SIO4C4]|nr:Uma2 family endonuclease [Kamptonema sp. SIO4C4]